MTLFDEVAFVVDGRFIFLVNYIVVVLVLHVDSVQSGVQSVTRVVCGACLADALVSHDALRTHRFGAFVSLFNGNLWFDFENIICLI